MSREDVAKLSMEERVHFMTCEVCGEAVDMRSIDEIIIHGHPDMEWDPETPRERKPKR